MSTRMRAHDGTLNRTVFWSSESIDSAGTGYSGPGPLTDIVVFKVDTTGGGGGGSALTPVHSPVFMPNNAATIHLIGGAVNIINADNATISGAFAAFPAASSVPNGTLLIVKLTSGSDDGTPTGAITFRPDNEDSLDGYGGTYPVFMPNVVGDSLIWVSDGASDWELISVWNPRSSGSYSFQYTATGEENPAGFPVTLPQVRVSASYNAVGNLAETFANYTVKCPPSMYASYQFTCVASAQPHTGDIIIFTISS